MYQLANNALRTKNMTVLLSDMGINLEGVNTLCSDNLVIFESENLGNNEAFLRDLQVLLEDGSSTQPKIKKFPLAELLKAEIETGSCSELEETHKESCNAVLNILIQKGLNYILDDEHEQIKIKLPSIAFAPLFKSLAYKYLSIVEDELRFNLKGFLKDHPNELVLVDSQKPLLCINAALFENKKVFYAEKELENGEIEVPLFLYS